jgi:hypothetical protein
MSVYIQAYQGLLGQCTTLWAEIKDKAYDANMEGAVKLLAYLGSMHAQSTMIGALATPQLKDCKTFIEQQVDSVYKATLYALAGTALLGLKIYVLPTVLPSEGSTYKKIVHQACSIGGIVLLLLGIFDILPSLKEGDSYGVQLKTN